MQGDFLIFPNEFPLKIQKFANDFQNVFLVAPRQKCTLTIMFDLMYEYESRFIMQTSRRS